MSKLQRTNERCYICDFSKPVDDQGNTADIGHMPNGGMSLYLDGLSSDLQDKSGRYVYLDPRDGKPICSHCTKAVDIAVSDFTAGEEVTWHDTNSRLFDKSLTVPADLLNNNIDWDNLEYNDNGTVKFPLKLKYQPRQIGYQLCEKVPQIEVTPGLRTQVDAIRLAKGYLLTPVAEETRCTRYNRAVEAFWSPVQSDPRLTGTSGWPVQMASGDPSEGPYRACPVN